MQIPQQAATGDWDSSFVGVPVSRTVADCEAAAARGEVCVIMTHPHEFANGTYSLTTLAQLVQSLDFFRTVFRTVSPFPLNFPFEDRRRFCIRKTKPNFLSFVPLFCFFSSTPVLQHE
jgi:hypothetical protein